MAFLTQCLSAALLLLLANWQVAYAAITAQCSACRAIAVELEARLVAEQPRNHLDMRHRLDKDGKRYGKVIDYQISELRVIHLLDDLCGTMKHYGLEEGGQSSRWVRSDSSTAGRSTNAEVAKQRRRQLENYCHDLLERHEDELSKALRSGRVTTDNASDWLCLDTAQHCITTVEAERAEQAQREAAERAAREAAAAHEAATGGEPGSSSLAAAGGHSEMAAEGVTDAAQQGAGSGGGTAKEEL